MKKVSFALSLISHSIYSANISLNDLFPQIFQHKDILAISGYYKQSEHLDLHIHFGNVEKYGKKKIIIKLSGNESIIVAVDQFSFIKKFITAAILHDGYIVSDKEPIMLKHSLLLFPLSKIPPVVKTLVFEKE